MNLGRCFIETKKYEEALTHLSKSKDQFKTLDAPEFVQKALVLIARVYENQNNKT